MTWLGIIDCIIIIIIIIIFIIIEVSESFAVFFALLCNNGNISPPVFVDDMGLHCDSPLCCLFISLVMADIVISLYSH